MIPQKGALVARTHKKAYGQEQGIALCSAIRRIRESKGLQQKAVALDAGLDATELSKIESAGRVPTLAQLVAIADALGIHYTDIHAEAGIQLGRFPSSRDAASTGGIRQLTPAEEGPTTSQAGRLTPETPPDTPATRVDLAAMQAAIEEKIQEAVTPLAREIRRLRKALRLATEESDARSGTPSAAAPKAAVVRDRSAKPAVRRGTPPDPRLTEKGVTPQEAVRKSARAAARRDAGHDPEVASEGQGGA